MAWYKTGTCTVTQGSTTIAGVQTLWLSTVRVGDIFTVDGVNSYEISAIPSNTSLTLARAYTGATASSQGYMIQPVSRQWEIGTKVAAQLADFTADYYSRVDNFSGVAGADGKPGWTMRGNWMVGISYSQGDLVAYNNGIWMSVLDSTGVTPVAGSAYWVNISTTTVIKKSGRPA